MNRYYIITNKDKDPDGTVTDQISEYLRSHGKECLISSQDDFSEKVECILVLGGDGTLLRAAREYVEYGLPFLGINLGTLGYLAEIERVNLEPALDCLMDDRYQLETRMMLSGSLFRDGQKISSDIALNDIVISREGPLRIVDFKNYVNGEFLNHYEADGIIISTPTGSTGYSLSAGGPIVAPTASTIIMTPVAAHTLNARSIIFRPEDRITIELGVERMENTNAGRVAFDGAAEQDLHKGDLVVIQKAAQSVNLVKISNISFLEVLRRKMVNQ